MAQITRRSFFGVLAAAAAATALDPERLLWVPGQRKIFIPAPARVIAASSLQVGDVITIAGRYAINPRTWERLEVGGVPLLQQFVVTADIAAGHEILAREVSPSIARFSADGDWFSESKGDYFNPAPLPPGDHQALPLLIGQTVPTHVSYVGEWAQGRPAGPTRGFALAPPGPPVPRPRRA